MKIPLSPAGLEGLLPPHPPQHRVWMLRDASFFFSIPEMYPHIHFYDFDFSVEDDSDIHFLFGFLCNNKARDYIRRLNC